MGGTVPEQFLNCLVNPRCGVLGLWRAYTYSWTPRRPSTSARVGPAERVPDWSCSASWCMRYQSGGSAAARVPAGEELVQRRQVDDGLMGDRFELGIERGDVGSGQGRADGGEGPLDVRMGPVVSLDGHDDA
jgi:hypothetical protein